MVNKLEIKITKALITQIRVDINNDKPCWYVQGKLLNEQNASVADFYFNTDYFIKEKSIHASLEIQDLGKRLFQAFTPIVEEKLGNQFMKIEAKNETSKEK